MGVNSSVVLVLEICAAILAVVLSTGLAGSPWYSAGAAAQDANRADSPSPKNASQVRAEPAVENPFPGRKLKAPPLDGGLGWLNAAGPIELTRLRGKIVLLDFWTFCCINCMHVLPDLAKLEAEFRNELVVIGVHSAKFEGERDSENLREAILRYAVKHPVVNDGDMAIWKSYGVRAWPTLVLIDPEGYYIGRLSGEGHYETFREAIRRLIKYHKAKGTLDSRPVHFQLESFGSANTPLRFPGKVAVDENARRLFVADSNHNRIVIVELDSGKVVHVVGDGRAALKDGSFAEARFNDPQGLAPAGDVVYVADTRNHAVRRINLASRRVETLAGTGNRGYERVGGNQPQQVSLASPWDLLLIEQRLFIAMAGLHQLWLYDLDTNTIDVFAGSGLEEITDGNRESAAFAQPSGLATDGQWLYVADSEVSGIRKVGLTVDRVETLVGSGLFDFGDVDGVGDIVRLQHCLGVAHHNGRLFIADTYNNKIKVVDPKTRRVTTLLGDGKPGSGSQPPRFNEPGGLAVAGDFLYVADTNNHRIRRIDLASKRIDVVELHGLSPPVFHDEDGEIPDSPSVNAAPVVLKRPRNLRIAGRVAVPTGHKLNDSAPMSYRIEVVTDAGSAQRVATGRIRPVNPSFVIPTGDTDLSHARSLRIGVVYYPCEEGENGLCRVMKHVWNVPVSFNSETGVDQITLPPSEL
jgi:DNA-binding beta-propeller fold protein YncE